MGDMSASGEKDPYMQAYITARMKNQVEEMKLQKMLSTMEVSQRVKKIMINLELFEDRKMAHKLQQEVLKVTKPKRKVMMNRHQHHNVAHHRTAKWTSSAMSLDQAYPLSHHSTDHHHSSHHPAHHASGTHAIYPVTKGKDYQHGSATGARQSFPDLSLPPSSRGPSGQQNLRHRPGQGGSSEKTNMPLIKVTDCVGEGATLVDASATAWRGGHCAGDRDTASAKINARLTHEHASTGAGTTVPQSTKTAIIVTPPPISGSHRGSHPPPISRPATEPHRRSVEGSVSFPPVVRARSTRTRYTLSSNTARTHEENKRQKSASTMWPGDPRAICSVRRNRRNVNEMLAEKKAGEETRRLIREARPACSRNCNKPNIMTLLERTYDNLPDLLPEIEKARKKLTRNDEPEEESDSAVPPLPDSVPVTSAEKKRRSVGRFELENEEDNGAKDLPIYKIDYNKLREIGGTRRNSVLA